MAPMPDILLRCPRYRPMVGRDPHEPHRVVTPLELLFDLTFVVAVGFAAERMHHYLSEDRIGHAVAGYALVFFSIWWAWTNFTWFASAYDTDDDLYRLTTLVQIAGSLVLAAGVPVAFDRGDLAAITYGYVVMRVAVVVGWLRAARADPERRGIALRFAAAVTVVQVGWVTRLALPDNWHLAATLALIPADLLVPVWAQRHARTTSHPHHIAERYGQFTIIVLGASVAAATASVRDAVNAGHFDGELLALAGAGLVIVFSMWWVYFDRPADEVPTPSRRFPWAYGHYLIFAAAGAVGAGLGVAIDAKTHTARLSPLAAGYAIALPVAVFLLAVWALRVQRTVALPVAAGLVLATPSGPAPVYLTAAVAGALVGVMVLIRDRRVR